MMLIPYIHFQGNCEEALNAYKQIFEAETGPINRYDNPALTVPEKYRNKILHSDITFGENTIMCDDAMPDTPIDYGNGMALSIHFKDLEKTTSVFNQLAEKGKIIVPLELQFWGSWFGEVEDRFGIRWMIMFQP